MALIDAGVDVVVIDTAHGHSKQGVLDAVAAIKRETNRVPDHRRQCRHRDGAGR
jgi:IMP dehydrogenase